MGLTSTAFIVLIQSTVGWEQRGIATASNMFMRNLGNTIGAALLGGILNSQLYAHLKSYPATEKMNVDSINILLNVSERNHISIKVKSILQEGLTSALHSVYFVVFLLAIASLILVIFLPKKKIGNDGVK